MVEVEALSIVADGVSQPERGDAYCGCGGRQAIKTTCSNSPRDGGGRGGVEETGGFVILLPLIKI